MKNMLLAILLVLMVAGGSWLARPLLAASGLFAPMESAASQKFAPGLAGAAAGDLPASGAPRAAEALPGPSSRSAVPRSVTAIGDSVMLSASGELQSLIANISIDAVVGRQVPAALEILRARQAAGTLGSVVVIHMGTNGSFTAAQFDEMMGLLSGVERVLFVDVKCPLAWETADNQMLQAAVARYPKAALVSWHAASASRPELFWDDGIHLRPEGTKVYAALVAAAVNGR